MAFQDIQILRVNYLRGPNIWTYRPIIEALIDLGEMEDHPSNSIEGFNDRVNYIRERENDYKQRLSQRASKYSLT